MTTSIDDLYLALKEISASSSAVVRRKVEGAERLYVNLEDKAPYRSIRVTPIEISEYNSKPGFELFYWSYRIPGHKNTEGRFHVWDDTAAVVDLVRQWVLEKCDISVIDQYVEQHLQQARDIAKL
jgi:hypothetical protein